MQENYDKFFEVNKSTWNKKVAIHKDSNFYNMDSFLRGNSSLNNVELDEVGSVAGKTLLHLQCHFGQDTLSWSRLGAQCTGIDLSDEGIRQAQSLNSKLGLDATFIESNVYDVPKNVTEKFDIVFTSYGVIGWLPDLSSWAQIISDRLNSGGMFYMIEFHPIVWMFDYLESPISIKYPYQKSEVIYEEYKGTYTNSDANIISKEYGWNHGLGDVISALTRAGLEIEFLHEFEESPYNCLPNMKETENGMYVLERPNNLFPLHYSVRAIKK